MLAQPGHVLTGKYPARHGVKLTLTEGDLFPDRRNVPTSSHVRPAVAQPRGPRRRLAGRFLRGLLRLGPKSGNEPELPPGFDTLATLLRERGYHVALKGKWHLSKPVAAALGAPPTPSGSSATTASRSGSRRTPAATRRRRRSAAATPARPTRLGRGLHAPGRAVARARRPAGAVLPGLAGQPHDVLGYPSFERGGYTAEQFARLGVPLPPTVDEDLRAKPTVHSLMKLGQTAYIGALRDDQARRDYVNFYAYLHRVVDEKIGRLLAALGDPPTPGRCARAR